MQYAKTKLKILIFFVVIACLTTLFSIILPYFNGLFIDELISNPKIETIVNYAIFIAVLQGAFLIINYLYGILDTKIRLDLSYKVYEDIITHIQKIPYIIFKKFNSSYLNQRINTDITRLWNFFLGYFINIFIQIIFLLLLLILIFNLNIYFFIATLILIPIYIGIYIWSKKPLYEHGLDSKEKSAKYFKTGTEQIEMADEIKANSLYLSSIKWLKKSFKEYYDSTMKFNKIVYFFRSLDLVASVSLQITVILIGGFGIISKNLTLGQFVIINSYYKMLIQTLKFFFSVGQEYQDTKNSYNRIQELTTIPVERQGSRRLENIEDIYMENIIVGYDNNPVLKGFSQKFTRGTIYLVEGQNGSGKTTFVLTLIGMLKTENPGKIYYNGINIELIDLEEIRHYAISTYLQNAKSFDSTVIDVFTFFTGLNKKQILEKIKGSILEKIYLKTNFDLSTYFDREFKELSGGEQQKIQILCNLISDSSVLIMDEPTAQIDKYSVGVIREYLESIKNTKIIIIITHDAQFVESFKDSVKIKIRSLKGDCEK